MDLIKITKDFLKSFLTVSVEVELTDDFFEKPIWTGNENLYDQIEYRTCPIRVNGFKSIAKYKAHLENMEYSFLSQFREWKTDKNSEQIQNGIYDVNYLINNALSLFRIKDPSEVVIFNNDGSKYATDDLYTHEGIITTLIGEDKHPEKDYEMDYFSELSYYIKTLFETLMHIRNYIAGYNEMLYRVQPLRAFDSFTLNKKFYFNITKAKELKDYLERREMIIEGNAYDIRRLFYNQKLNRCIQWIKGPGHLKDFIRILKKENIIETESIFEIVIKCFEFTGKHYNEKITIDKIKHGHTPRKSILNPNKIIECFPLSYSTNTAENNSSPN